MAVAAENIIVERMTSEDFRPNKSLVYEDVFDLHTLFDGMQMEGNLILMGPKGIGKSLSVAAFAADKEIPLITVSCSEDLRRSGLVGSYALRGDQTPFVLGPIPTAIEVANETGRAILVLEEINALSPQCQKILNNVTDFHRAITVPEAKKVYQLDEGAKLWVVGSMNSAVYGGVYELNEDLKSRFNLAPLDYPSATLEAKILKRIFPNYPHAKVMEESVRLAAETRQGQFGYALSTRDVVQFLVNYKNMPPKRAFWLLTGKFEAEDRPTVTKRIVSLFGVQI